MKKKNPYATMNPKPIKAPKSGATDAPRADRTASDVDMRVKVTK